MSISVAHANLVSYTETAVGSGVLDGTSFSNALITITATADTDNIKYDGNGVYYDYSSATVNVNGKTDTFSSLAEVFDNTSASVAGIGVLQGANLYELDVLDTKASTFSTYNLSSAIGPVTGNAYVGTLAFATINGTFSFNTSGNSTFTAALCPAPEPAPIAIAILSLGCMFVFSKRRQ